MVSAEDLVRCLGTKHTDETVRWLLREMQILRKPYVDRVDNEDAANSEVTNPQDWLSNPSLGIEFGFEDEAAFLGSPMSTWGEGPMLLTQIYLYSNHTHQNPYRGELPFGIVHGDGPNELRAKVDPRAMRRRSRNRDTWVFPNCMMTAEYSEDGGPFTFLVFLIEPKPLPPDLADRCPDITALTSIMGLPTNDERLIPVIGKMGFPRTLRRVNDTLSECDLREDFGAMIQFGERDDSGYNHLFKFSMYGDGRFGSAYWPGQLPGGLTFESGWDEIIAAAGGEPDKLLEQDFVVSGFWQGPDVATEIEYSTMSNHILSVSFFVPAEPQANNEGDDQEEDGLAQSS